MPFSLYILSSNPKRNINYVFRKDLFCLKFMRRAPVKRPRGAEGSDYPKAGYAVKNKTAEMWFCEPCSEQFGLLYLKAFTIEDIQ